MVDKLKTCTSCEKSFPPKLFHKDARSRDGRRSRCSYCISEIAKADSEKVPVVDPEVTHKSCPRCKHEGREHFLPVGEFGVARRRKDGRNSWCKSCCCKASLAWQRTEVGRLKHIQAVNRYRERMKSRGLSAT